VFHVELDNAALDFFDVSHRIPVLLFHQQFRLVNKPYACNKTAYRCIV
jgi:hypothetical protein